MFFIVVNSGLFQKIYPYVYEVDRRTVKTDIERLNKINFYIEEYR